MRRFIIALIAGGIAYGVFGDSTLAGGIVFFGAWITLHIISPGTCPHCGKGVKFLYGTCHHCGRDIRPVKSTAPENPPARITQGWYLDPNTHDRLRYWSGSEWTNQTRAPERPAEEYLSADRGHH